MKRYLKQSIFLFIFIIPLLIFGYFLFATITNKESEANLNALKDNSWESISKKAVEKYVGNPLILPYVDSLYMEESDYLFMNKLPLKIVNFIDGDCSTCLLKIDFWKKFISETEQQGYSHIPVIMYAYSSLEERKSYESLQSGSGRHIRTSRSLPTVASPACRWAPGVVQTTSDGSHVPLVEDRSFFYRMQRKCDKKQRGRIYKIAIDFHKTGSY